MASVSWLEQEHVILAAGTDLAAQYANALELIEALRAERDELQSIVDNYPEIETDDEGDAFAEDEIRRLERTRVLAAVRAKLAGLA